MKKGLLKRTVLVSLAVLILPMFLASLFSCSRAPSSKPSEITNAAKTLKDGTKVEPYFKTYFEARGYGNPENEALWFAAKISLAGSKNVTASDEEIADYVEKADGVFDLLRSQNGESDEEVCKREFGISLSEYREISKYNLLIEKTYEKLTEELEATDEEAADYLAENRIKTLYFLKASFSGKKLPKLPEGMTVEGYPDDIGDVTDFAALMGKIAEAVKSQEDMLALIETNGQDRDEYIYFFGDLEKGVQEALSDHDPDKTFSFFNGKNHILLFAVEGAGNAYDDLSDIKEKLTNDRVETAVEEYVSTLLR